ncbi:hypothetical protein [Bdellovibrio sp. NC01]|uniref:hypothetical protein n=1 Tax=Bdellovibrio sp. NC01 TaxID=2220073 RepID=UPI001158C864|nr:hypothetical protein [Bdellovibrio sp. NC01]QDK38652.1 hypothetical protein DOE51_14200 [Bdellovibrio sp. NC01]
MKNLMIVLSLVFGSLTASAAQEVATQGPLANALVNAYRDYADRSQGYIVPGQIEVSKILYHGKQLSNPAAQIYTAYLKVGRADWPSTAVQFKVLNGAIDSFEGMFSVSAQMIRHQDGTDARFPMGFDESAMALLYQEAFEAAKSLYIQAAGGKDYVGTFYVQTFDASETLQPKISISVSSFSISKDGRDSTPSQQSYILLSTKDGKVLNVKKGWYY